MFEVCTFASLYYRHTEEMIEKLESAGLGFYVKATETQQKLGSFQITKYLYCIDKCNLP